MPPVTDLAALRNQLAEYDPSAPRCSKKVAEHRNYAPSDMKEDDPEWSDFTVTTYAPCCRPAGHAGECRNSRRVMGWPGRSTLLALIDEVEHLRAAASPDPVTENIVSELVRLFGWEDKTPLHAVLHVENAVGNLRADLAVARSEVQRVTEKHDRLQERLTDIERANVDRWKDGYAAAERQVVAWLRTAPCGSPGHDPRWCQDCEVRECAADLIEGGAHRPLKSPS